MSQVGPVQPAGSGSLRVRPPSYATLVSGLRRGADVVRRGPAPSGLHVDVPAFLLQAGLGQ